ncbi:MAG: multidrug efflux SMR transporter [Chlorobium sp.]
MKWIFLILAIVGEVIATTSLKMSDGFTKIIPNIISVIGYGVTFYFFSLALRDIPVSIAYAIWSGLGILFMSILGIFFFGQSIDIAGVLGISLILIGIAIINLFSKMAAH